MDPLNRCLLFVGLLFGLLVIFPFPGGGQVSVDVHIGPPPPYRIAAPPPVVVIPGTYVYAVPDIETDILFYSGYWYRPHGGHWFRARSYNGPWAYWPDPRVPRALLELPPDYRRLPPGYRRIPHREFKSNWARWERDRYWERDRGWREGRHEERREEKREHLEGRPGEGHGRGPERGEHGHGRE
jgi:hypothetical protein